MMTLLVILVHPGFDAVFGWTLLSLRKNDRSWAETLLVSVLLGMYLETLLVASFLFLGFSLVHAAFAMTLIMGGLTVTAFLQGKLKITLPSIGRPAWYEWAALVAIVEQVLFAAWQLVRTHTYFDDALTHWSGRARALYGGVNWSMDPASPFFLGEYIGSRNYPLQVVIWRALSAKMNGSWNDVITRADSLLFFIVIVGTIWFAVSRFSNTKWLAAAAAFIVAIVPLHAWHAAAGYADIAVEAFVVASLAALLRREWLLGGVLAAGAVWCKNDGIFLYLPAIFAAVVLLQIRLETRSLEWRNVARFVLGFVTIAPWLIFSFIHKLGLTAGQGSMGWHSDAPLLLWKALITSQTSSIFWVGVFGGLIYTCLALLRDSTGRGLIAVFALMLGAITFTFTSTSAYEFLVNGQTIYRVLMQFSSVAVLVVTYGLWLKMPSLVPEPSPPHLSAATPKRKRKR